VAVSNVELRVDARNAVQALKKASDESKKLETATKGVTSATTKAGREIKTAANGMRYFTDAAGRARKVNGQFVTTAEAAAAGLKGQGTAAKAAAGNFDGLAKKAAGLAAAYIGLNAAQNAVRQGIQRIESERRIEFLAKGYGEVAALQDAATKAAKRFGTGQTEANRALADVFARLRPVGVGLNDIVSVYNGFNTAARISGSTAVESANAFRQLSQALGSGALRGDEFNSISEQVPGILTAISKETGVAQGQLRKFAAEGGITADVVIRALKRIETEGAAQLEAALGGPAQAIADFQNAAEDVQVALTKDIVPQMAEVFRGLAELIVNLEGPIRFIGGVAANTLNQINSLITQATQPAATAARRDIEAGLIPTNIVAGLTGGDVRGGAKQLFGEAGLKELEDRAREFSQLRGQGFQETLLQFMQDRLTTMDAAANLDANLYASTGGTSPISQLLGGDQAGKQKVDISQKVLDLNLKLLAAQESEQKRLAATLALMVEKENILQSGLQPREEELRMAQAMSTFRQEIKGIDKEIADQRVKDIEKAAEGFEAQMAHQDELRQAIAEQKSAYEELNATFRNGIVDSILDAVEGTRSLKDSLLGVIKSMARLILQQQLMNALGGFNLFGGGGGGAGGGFGVTPATSGLDFSGAFANGGRPAVGKAALVGERGPELFVPDRPGTIVPNHAMGSSNIVVNVDASGSNVQGDAQQGKALGQAIGAAVQAELIKQKRPGGLLS